MTQEVLAEEWRSKTRKKRNPIKGMLSRRLPLWETGINKPGNWGQCRIQSYLNWGQRQLKYLPTNYLEPPTEDCSQWGQLLPGISHLSWTQTKQARVTGHAIRNSKFGVPWNSECQMDMTGHWRCRLNSSSSSLCSVGSFVCSCAITFFITRVL